MEQVNLNKVNEELMQLKKEFAERKASIGEDIEFAIRTELAWQEVEEGKYTEHSSPKEFFKSLKNDD